MGVDVWDDEVGKRREEREKTLMGLSLGGGGGVGLLYWERRGGKRRVGG